MTFIKADFNFVETIKLLDTKSSKVKKVDIRNEKKKKKKKNVNCMTTMLVF